MSSNQGPASATPSVDDLRAGSEPAWSAAVRLLGPPLRGFISLRGAHDPDGVLGDVFLELSREVNRRDIADWAAFRTLAFVIARRRVIDSFRSAARRPTDLVDSQTLEGTIVGGDVEQEAIDRLNREWVLGWLALLTPTQRDVLTMRFVSGLTISEVARVTGTTQTGVKANQRRAIAALRRHLTESSPPQGSRPNSADDIAHTLGRLR